jgi:hypothetical protein
VDSSGGTAKGTGRPALGLVPFNDYFYLGSPRVPLKLGQGELQRASSSRPKGGRCYRDSARSILHDRGACVSHKRFTAKKRGEGYIFKGRNLAQDRDLFKGRC